MNAIIIPTYQPDHHLNQLVKELFALGLKQIVVVDDGSTKDHQSLFNILEKQGCQVLHHPSNMGKGAAIKTGIKYVYDHLDLITGYITCDADGQHQSADILNISTKLTENPNSIILGSRDFSNKDVPLKSKVGNRFSSFYFKAATGVKCNDTQTGLRGIPASLTNEALAIEENRYDYEMTFLTKVAKKSYPILFVPIETTYIDDNSSSHFKPLLDSFRIYKKPLRFALSSILCAVVDLSIFALLTTFLDKNIVVLVTIATITARIISGILNFLLNRNWSFNRRSGSIKRQFKRYFVLYIAQLLLSILFVTLLSVLPINLTVIKLFVDSMLFIGSFFIQKNWVFRKQQVK